MQSKYATIFFELYSQDQIVQMRRLLFSTPSMIIGALLLSIPVTGQRLCGFDFECSAHAACEQGLVANDEDVFSYTPPPAVFHPNASRESNFIVTYVNFPDEAIIAFDYATDIWATLLNSEITIRIDASWGGLPSGTLAQAGPNTVHANFQGAPFSDTNYASALANALLEDDLSDQSDISCAFNSEANWYFGTDGQTPAGNYDLVTAVLHELSHGLGFIGSAFYASGIGFIGINGTPYAYDQFTETVDSIALLDLPNGSFTLGNALTSNQIYWNGVVGGEGVGGGRPRIHAPVNYQSGSSYSHLNESTYAAGSPNALMTPALNASESNHNPGPAVLGIFEDIGWVISGCQFLELIVGEQSACYESTGTFAQSIALTYQGQPQTGVINVNGSLYSLTASPNTINLTGLVTDGQPVDIEAYFTADPACNASFEDAFIAPSTCACLTDLSGNGVTEIQDLLILLADFGCITACNGDVTNDGASNVEDILALLSAFGIICP